MIFSDDINVMPGVARIRLFYDKYVASDGDVLLWEAETVEGHAIRVATGGPFCHASAVVKIVQRPFQAAYREGVNGYLSPLSAEVRRHNGKISVFRPFDNAAGVPFGADTLSRVAFELMNSLGGDYAWPNLALIYAQQSRAARIAERLPWIGKKLREIWDAELALQSRKRTSAVCSQHVVRAWREGAGFDLVDDRPLPLVSPNDIARSCREAYLGTLTWPETWMKGKHAD